MTENLPEKLVEEKIGRIQTNAVYAHAKEGADGILTYRGGAAVDFKPLS